MPRSINAGDTKTKGRLINIKENSLIYSVKIGFERPGHFETKEVLKRQDKLFGCFEMANGGFKMARVAKQPGTDITKT